MSYLPLIFLLFSPAFLSGQTIVGHVRDTLGEAIAFASVVATGCGEERILAFTTTDASGHYSLQLATDCDTVVLTARGLGYQPDSKVFVSRPWPVQQDFVLVSAGLSIREITVRDKPPPVVGRKDTTEYDAAAFSDSTEFSVEDLLKKIPGVRVAENGVVTYNGKTVQKVQIEGDDLFNSNYQIATRNLRAGMIGKIQMIDRYQENPILKGLQASEALVMNLTIRPDRKRQVSGNVNCGLGYGDEWKGKSQANLFSLSRTDKFYLMANANNTGEDVLADVEWASQGGGISSSNQSLLQTNPLAPSELVRLPVLENVGLPAVYTQTNRGGLLFLGEVWPVSAGFKVKMSGWMGKERLQQASRALTRYLLDGNALEIAETRTVHLRSQTRHLQLATEYFSKDQRQALRGFMSLTGNPGSGSLRILRDPAEDTTQLVSERVEADVFKAFGALEYTLKVKEGLVIQLMNKNAWYDDRYALRSGYAYYSYFFAQAPGFNDLLQNTGQRQSLSVLLLRVLTRTKAIQWQLEAGRSWSWEKLRSELYLQNGEAEIWAPDRTLYYNQLRLRAPHWLVEGGATYGSEIFYIRLKGKISYRRARLAIPDRTVKNRSPWSAESRLDLRYAPGERAALTGFYHFQQALPGMIDLYPAYLFTDYQALQRGVPDLAWINGHEAGLVYRYNDRLRQFSWNVGGSWRRNVDAYGTRYQIDPFLVIQDAFRPVGASGYTWNAGIDRYVKQLGMRFALDAGFSDRQQKAGVNGGMLRNLHTRSYLIGIHTGTAFDGWVNAIVDSRFSRVVLYGYGGGRLRAPYWFSTLQITVKPVARFHLKLFVHHTASRIPPAFYHHFYAADGSALLRLPKWHSELELTAFNLLGTRRFEQVAADALVQTRTSVAAAGRFFSMSWGVDF